MVKSVTVRAPCSTANLGPGFDVFGLALDAFYDEVTVTKKGKGITIVSSDDIPLDPKKNTAGIVAEKMIDGMQVRDRNVCYQISIKKNVPDFFFHEAEIGKDLDQRNYIVSNAKIEATGFRPRYSLDQGILELTKGYTMIKENKYRNF